MIDPLAMANDPGLGKEIEPVVQLLALLASPDRLTAESIGVDEERRTCYLMTREAMLGLAAGRSTNGGRPLGHGSAVRHVPAVPAVPAVLAVLPAGATRLDVSTG